jgi:hypothetical protein
MVLPASPNPLSFSQINTEFGFPSNQGLALSNPYIKTLFSDWSNPISISNGRGKDWPLIHPSVQNVNLFYSPSTGNITVPAGAYRVSIKAWGGGGGSGGRWSATGAVIAGGGGSGASLWGIYDVSPGETLSYQIGQAGSAGDGTQNSAGEGGGGGGATTLRNMSRSGQPYYFIVGGGGGGGGTAGAGVSDHGAPGGGAGLIGITGYNAGVAGSSLGGNPGTGSAGGTGGTGTSGNGGNGTFIDAGNGGGTGAATIGFGGAAGGGDGGKNGSGGGGGGGGGGGHFGGGGGGWTSNQGGGGGGGGSTYYQGYLLHLIALENGRSGSLNILDSTDPLYTDANWNDYGRGAYPAYSGFGTNYGQAGRYGAISLQFFTT